MVLSGRITITYNETFPHTIIFDSIVQGGTVGEVHDALIHEVMTKDAQKKILDHAAFLESKSPMPVSPLYMVSFEFPEDNTPKDENSASSFAHSSMSDPLVSQVVQFISNRANRILVNYIVDHDESITFGYDAPDALPMPIIYTIVPLTVEDIPGCSFSGNMFDRMMTAVEEIYSDEPETNETRFNRQLLCNSIPESDLIKMIENNELGDIQKLLVLLRVSVMSEDLFESFVNNVTSQAVFSLVSYHATWEPRSTVEKRNQNVATLLGSEYVNRSFLYEGTSDYQESVSLVAANLYLNHPASSEEDIINFIMESETLGWKEFGYEIYQKTHPELTNIPLEWWEVSYSEKEPLSW